MPCGPEQRSLHKVLCVTVVAGQQVRRSQQCGRRLAHEIVEVGAQAVQRHTTKTPSSGGRLYARLPLARDN
jgi:hypothetical protein